MNHFVHKAGLILRWLLRKKTAVLRRKGLLLTSACLGHSINPKWAKKSYKILGIKTDPISL